MSNPSRSTRHPSSTSPRLQVRHILAVSLGALAIAAQAQGTAAPSADSTPAANSTTAAFTRADSNADGKLTKQEAARLPAIASRFDELDKDKDGVLTSAEFDTGAAMKK